MSLSERERLTSLLDRLLAAHDEILNAMRCGQVSVGAPSRLLKINARIHAAYRQLAALEPQNPPSTVRPFRELEDLLA